MTIPPNPKRPISGMMKHVCFVMLLFELFCIGGCMENVDTAPQYDM